MALPVALLLGLWLAWPPLANSQPGFDAKELAAYRLTMPAFKRFAHASRLIGAVTQRNPHYAHEPLFTKEVALSGDAPEAAATLVNRLDRDPELSAALFAADMSAREYATFALSLLAARLAHGFMQSGALRRVPAGVTTDNVAFIRENLTEVTTVLRQLGIE